MKSFFSKAIHILFAVIMIWTVFLLVGFHEIANVFTSRQFLLEDGGFLLIGFLLRPDLHTGANWHTIEAVPKGT